MRKLIVALVVGLTALVLASCGGPSLTSTELKAVRGVEQNIDAFGAPQSYASPQVIGTVAKDSQGNKVTMVYVEVTDPSQPKGSQKWSLIVIIVETTGGKLVFADASLPSRLVTVTS